MSAGPNMLKTEITEMSLVSVVLLGLDQVQLLLLQHCGRSQNLQ